jgi:hypothetical protein
MKKTILLFFIFLCLNILKAQNREVVIFFNDSTSLDGFGEVKNDKIYFKLEQKDKPTVFDYNSVHAIHFVGYGFIEKYEYVKSDKYKKPKIMELVEKGKITLYMLPKQIIITNIVSDINYQVRKTNSDFNINENPNNPVKFINEYFIKFPTNETAIDIVFSFKKRVLRYFSDCPELIEKVNNKTFTKSTIPEMIYFYNDYCNDEF